MPRPLILRNRNFCLLWISQVISQAGIRLFQLGLVWWIISHLKDSAGLILGLFMVMGALPAIVAVKWIGRMVDRHSPRRILLTVDTLGMLTAILLSVWFHTLAVSMIIIMAAAFCFALYQAYIDPTLNKAVPLLVAETDLERAVAFVSSSITLANFSGAVLGALVLEWLGLNGVVLLNGLTYLISIFCDSSIRFTKAGPQNPAEPDTPEASESLSLLLKRLPLIKVLLVGFSMVNFFGTPILVILPIYTKTVLEGGAGMLSSLEACVWMGILLGTFGSPRFGWKQHPLKVVCICILAFGALLGLPSLQVNAFIYGACLALAGTALGLLNVRMVTLFQRIIPNQLKGSFFSLLQAGISFTVPAGYFSFGLLADHFNAPLLSLIQGGGILAVSILFLLVTKREAELSKEVAF